MTSADVLVFAFPLWNLTIPSALQAFINYNLQASFSFKYNEQGQKEFLLGSKKVILLNARGGLYSLTEVSAMEMAVNYMRIVVQNFFGFEILD
ncbi:NAD(P)H-dependent oxidoreductase [Paenibacillus sp. PCH8]|uniref:NAD(P)H-dependent oxidoreductase n=1 Tax=Paenibacillus sp. PCH8 TaxID=2066524 RepID=UPI0026AFB18B|nr:NAD(P)H-dependent oxidoreductase [Paenibacillus sp. PCH8]